jgi:3-dehydroquinate synthase
MQTLRLEHTRGTCQIHVGLALLQDGIVIEPCIKLGNHIVIITDDHVGPLYTKSLILQLQRHAMAYTLIEIPAGEKSKTRDMKCRIEDRMLSDQCGRDSIILAIGGGVVTDIAGFVAATFCRGIPSINVPTTLLAMVDAAIGGKTGVNSPQGKNMIGCFYQAQHVFCDISTLETLPKHELANGLVETLKHALIWDIDLFKKLEPTLNAFSQGVQIPSSEWQAIIRHSCHIKTTIVEQDEQEINGIRQLLNFGHTVAHAIERFMQYSISHGQAVAIGIWVESYLANIIGILDSDDFNNIKVAVAKLYDRKQRRIASDDIQTIIDHMCLDKKAKNKTPRFVLIRKLGSAYTKNNGYSFEVKDRLIKQALEAWIKGPGCDHY